MVRPRLSLVKNVIVNIVSNMKQKLSVRSSNVGGRRASVKPSISPMKTRRRSKMEEMEKNEEMRKKMEIPKVGKVHNDEAEDKKKSEVKVVKTGEKDAKKVEKKTENDKKKAKTNKVVEKKKNAQTISMNEEKKDEKTKEKKRKRSAKCISSLELDSDMATQYKKRMKQIVAEARKGYKDEIFYGPTAERVGLCEEKYELVAYNRSGRVIQSLTEHYVAHPHLNIHNPAPLLPPRPCTAIAEFKLGILVKPATKAELSRLNKLKRRCSSSKSEHRRHDENNNKL